MVSVNCDDSSSSSSSTTTEVVTVGGSCCFGDCAKGDAQASTLIIRSNNTTRLQICEVCEDLRPSACERLCEFCRSCLTRARIAGGFGGQSKSGNTCLDCLQSPLFGARLMFLKCLVLGTAQRPETNLSSAKVYVRARGCVCLCA